MIGQLMYLTTTTQPNIQYAVNTLSQYLSWPQEVHEHVAKHILWYLQGTLNHHLSYMKVNPESSPKPCLFGYIDSSHVNT